MDDCVETRAHYSYHSGTDPYTDGTMKGTPRWVRCVLGSGLGLFKVMNEIEKFSRESLGLGLGLELLYWMCLGLGLGLFKVMNEVEE